MKSKVTKEEVKYSGKFLDFKEIEYTNKNGKESKWESVSRSNNVEAVSIIPILIPSQKYVVIKQYRPTVDGYVLSFPAGLVDGEDSYGKSALRELKEETGYSGKVIKVTPPTLSSDGMTDEAVAIAIVNIDENKEENKNPVQNLEESEDIEVILVRDKDFKLFIEEELKSGSMISGRFTSYLLGKDLI